MSSHAIIRDNQEPALLAWSSHSLLPETVFSLLEWSPLVLVTEECLPFFLSHELNLDALLARDTSLHWENVLAWQWPVSVIPYESFEEADRFLTERAISEVNIIASPAIFPEAGYRLMREKRQVIFYEGIYKIIDCYSGKYRKWMSPGRKLSIELLEGDENSLNLTNLKEFDPGHYTVNNEGLVSVTGNGAFRIREVIH